MKVLAPLAAAYILAFPSLAACQVGEGTPHSGDAERPDYSKSHGFSNILSPYIAPSVPVPRLDNSRRLQNLIVDGKLVLALDDAIALALENNLEIAVARYDLPIAQTELLRARGGGATRGVGGSVQSSTLFPGSLGGGVGSGGAASGTGAGGILGGGINNVSSARCCDPSLSVGYGWSNAITPLNYTVVTGVPIDTSHEALASVEYSQGFLTGTSLFVSESSSRLSSNSKTAIFNPELVSGLTVGVSQHLLKGFGVRANSRFIRIARNDLKYSASIFRQNVIVVVAAVMTTYYDLVADEECTRVAQQGLDHAQKLLEHNQAEVKIQPSTQYDVLRSEEEVAFKRQDLMAAQSAFSQDAQSLKAKIFKSFNDNLATIEISTSSRLPDPQPGDVPTLADALREAASHRPEIEQVELGLQNQQIAIQETHNSLLPALDVYASYYLAGLGGALRPTLTDVLQNDFPNFSYGVKLNLPIRNRTAQADAARALLEQRRLQLKLQAAKSQGVWKVSKAISAAQQAREQLDDARKLVTLSHQVLELLFQRKSTLGSVGVEEVITAQRNLASAEDHVLKARTTYAKALIEYEQETGTLLERNHIEMSDAVEGVIR